MNTNITDIAFEQIKDNYYWAAYGDFKVIMDISNGYINATRLCSLATNRNGNRKELSEWKRSEFASLLLDELSSSLEYSRDDLLKVVTGGQITEIRGTYAHIDLIPHIASWASSKFAIKISKIVNEYFIREYKESIRIKDQKIDSLEATVRRIEQQNAEQAFRISELLNEVKAGREENSHVIGQLDVITSELENVSVVNEELTEKITTANNNIDEIAKKLDIATDQRVPPAKREVCNEVFAIYRNPKTNKFYMIRRQKRTVNAGIENCRRNGFTERIFYSDSPNSVNLGVRIKDTFPRDLGTITGTIITLANGKDIFDLLTYVNTAEVEKKII